MSNISSDEWIKLFYDWYGVFARPKQIPPTDYWYTWFLLCGRGYGKMLDVDTDIKTANGWKKLRDIVRGDYVFSLDGKPTKVLIAHNSKSRPAYRFIFDTGEQHVCCKDHLWYTISKNEEKQIRRGKRNRGSIKTTQEIVDSVLYLNRETNHRIPTCGSLDLPRKKLSVHPYLLGIWLGDGVSANSEITCNDDEMLVNIQRLGYIVEHKRELQYLISNGATTLRDTKTGRFVANGSVHSRLRSMNLLHNKHVPQIYLNASDKQRTDLLMGLMDSDGYCGTNGWCEFVTIKKELADNVLELIASLGIKARMYVADSKFYGRLKGKKYRIFFKTDKEVFLLRRKLNRQRMATKNQLCRHKNRYIVRVERVERCEMRCLTVDSSDGLFLIGKSFIATHNTRAGAEWIRERVKQGFKRIAMVAPTAADARDVMVEGEALDPSTPIPIPSGWIPIGNMKVGDELFNKDGNIVNVLAVCYWDNRPLYKLDIVNASPIIADAKHLWVVYDRAGRRNKKKLKSKLLSTEKIRETVRKRRIDLCEYAIPMNGKCELSEKKLPIPPYTLGAWLGDGDTRGHGVFTCDPKDVEIIYNIRLDGFAVSNHKDKYSWGILKIKKLLQQNKLAHNKHIPSIYLRAGHKQRLAVLQGLMDTDGCIDYIGRCSFDNSNYDLVKSVRELVLTFGLRPGKIRKKPPRNTKHKMMYRFQFIASVDIQVFRLKRKTKRQPIKQASQTCWRLIKEVEFVGYGKSCCIQVSGDGSFLAGDDFIPTHNSGILAISPPWDFPKYEPSKRRLTWKNGAMATLYTAEEPARLNGPQHDTAWCDEVGVWKYARETWDMLQMGLRLGDDPRQIVTTTPKVQNLNLLKEIRDMPDTVMISGSTYENKNNLSGVFFKQTVAKYEGTRVGRQELNAELLEDVLGALWTRKLIDKNRIKKSKLPEMLRIVVGVDPQGKKDERKDLSLDDNPKRTGIYVCGIGANGHGYTLANYTCNGTPKLWGNEVIKAYDKWHADRVVGEKNYGGDMVKYVIKSIDPDVSYKDVNASRGKYIRAEPISAFSEQGKTHHAGSFADLEDEQCSYTPESDFSPNNLDAWVWAMTELMLQGSGDWAKTWGTAERKGSDDPISKHQNPRRPIRRKELDETSQTNN